MKLILTVILILSSFVFSTKSQAVAPYPPSKLLTGVIWHWDTLRQAAFGSDLWPITWAKDGSLYAAWGDGGGFGGSDSDGRVAMGFARIEGEPQNYQAVNVNGGKNPEHSGSFPKSGKTGGILSVGDTLYAWINMQNGPWPNVDDALAWSKDEGATWTLSTWRFPKGKGNFKPGTFLNFGKGYTGVPNNIKGFIYFYATREGDDSKLYLGRAPEHRLQDRTSYSYWVGFKSGKPEWSGDNRMAKPIFEDPKGAAATVTYDPALKRYLLTAFHSGPGQLGIFDAPKPWGPWTTVAYYEKWGKMGSEGEGLNCSFPQKWMSQNGLTIWCVFSAYGQGAKEGVDSHDRFNLVEATLILR